MLKLHFLYTQVSWRVPFVLKLLFFDALYTFFCFFAGWEHLIHLSFSTSSSWSFQKFDLTFRWYVLAVIFVYWDAKYRGQLLFGEVSFWVEWPEKETVSHEFPSVLYVCFPPTHIRYFPSLPKPPTWPPPYMLPISLIMYIYSISTGRVFCNSYGRRVPSRN